MSDLQLCKIEFDDKQFIISAELKSNSNSNPYNVQQNQEGHYFITHQGQQYFVQPVNEGSLDKLNYFDNEQQQWLPLNFPPENYNQTPSSGTQFIQQTVVDYGQRQQYIGTLTSEQVSVITKDFIGLEDVFLNLCIELQKRQMKNEIFYILQGTEQYEVEIKLQFQVGAAKKTFPFKTILKKQELSVDTKMELQAIQFEKKMYKELDALKKLIQQTSIRQEPSQELNQLKSLLALQQQELQKAKENIQNLIQEQKKPDQYAYVQFNPQTKFEDFIISQPTNQNSELTFQLSDSETEFQVGILNNGDSSQLETAKACFISIPSGKYKRGNDDSDKQFCFHPFQNKDEITLRVNLLNKSLQFGVNGGFYPPFKINDTIESVAFFFNTNGNKLSDLVQFQQGFQY